MKGILIAVSAFALSISCQGPNETGGRFTKEEASALVGQHVECVGDPLPFIPIAYGRTGQTIYLRPGMQGMVVALDERPKGNFGVIVRWDLPDVEGGPWTSWISRYSSRAIRVVPVPKP